MNALALEGGVPLGPAVLILAPLLGVGSIWASRRLIDPPAALSPYAMAAVPAAQIGLALWVLVLRPPMGAALASLGLSCALLVLTVVDIADLRLPDIVTLPLAAAGLAVSVVERTGVAAHLVGAAAGWAALAGLAAGFRRLRGHDGLGLGDAKLLGAAGAWCGWRALPWILLLACALGFVWAGMRLLRTGRINPAVPLPFGPALALAFWITRLHGAPL